MRHRIIHFVGRRAISTSSRVCRTWQTIPQQTEGVPEEFQALWESVLDAEATGKHNSAVDKARECVELASRGDRGSLGREHALRMSHHAVGLALLRLGQVDEALISLEKSKEIAVKVSSAGAGDDAYVDVGGVLNDLGVGKALLGDLEGAQKDISRTLYMGERAYRPDDDLVSAACSNIAEILGAKGDSYEEEAVGYAERAVRLTDKMEKLSMIYQSKAKDVPSASSSSSSSDPASSSSCPGKGGGQASITEEDEIEEDERASSPHRALFALPAELLALHVRSITRRLNLGRALIRCHRPQEAALYIYQALQDVRASGLRLNAAIYAQCLAAASSTHLSSLLRSGQMADVSHLVAAGCGPDHEMFFEPTGLMERAVSVLGPVLGEHHPETLACKSNLALFLPLELGVQSMEEITAGGGGGTPPVSSRKRGGGGGGSIRRRKESPCIPPGSVQSSSEDGEGGARSLLPAGLEHNRLALQNMLAAVGPLTSRSQSAAAIASEIASSSGGEGRGPKVIFAINGVLGVGLRGWRGSGGAGAATAGGGRQAVKDRTNQSHQYTATTASHRVHD